MTLHFEKMNTMWANEVNTWSYEKPYNIYDMTDEDVVEELLTCKR